MTTTEAKKLLRLVKANKIKASTIGIFIYIQLAQGLILKYGELSKDLNMDIKVLKNHVRALENLHILSRKIEQRGVSFTLYPTKTWVGKSCVGKGDALYIYCINSVSKEFKEEITKILDDLGNLAKHNFKLTDGTVKLITARLNEGYTVDDFLLVHRNQQYWLKSEKWAEYFRPATLYRTSNFPKYLDKVIKYDTDKKTTSKWQAPEYQADIDKTDKLLREASSKLSNYYDENEEEDII